jgi:hypothetical protein
VAVFNKWQFLLDKLGLLINDCFAYKLLLLSINEQPVGHIISLLMCLRVYMLTAE